MINILHIISSLDAGGAERALYHLLTAMDHKRFNSKVIGLRGEGEVGSQIREMGISVQALNLSPNLPSPRALAQLTDWTRDAQPALVQTWMYHADLLGGWASRRAGKPRLVWGLHHSDLSIRNNRFTTLMVAKINAMNSHRLPDRIISPSRVALEAHARFGYDRERMVYIPNGFDLARYQPDAAARASLRAELGLDEKTHLIGMAARFHPLKDHATFIRAAAVLSATMPDVHFLLCGWEIDWNNYQLASKIHAAGLAERFHLLGVRPDIARVFNGLDVGTLTSLSEAFPSVVGEMMACGLPCVITNAGDAAEISGDCGVVVPVADAPALVAAWERLLELTRTERTQLGKTARQRIINRFSIERMAADYQALYESLLE